ncbi:6-carboxytetrahydropterin synthase [Chitinophaga lutea]|uniref:6-carboxy-5,6,7,8-tetrahydropterin synthase n=1 Tax=Chitinophaga lutea TaxID=2488634 RepID=A0A3N4PH39_9BACT|nr:6-carboxytetrahydropterin synthase [Chitinophaga lutea]RPE08013.1 6-carboxytetrahydropterin synthase [Chitinophaga lutea]
MLQVTKIFRFETAHALHGYNGPCRLIHGHSYQLHVTVRAQGTNTGYLPAPGILLDFKDLKQLVNEAVVKQLDHRLVLSEAYLRANPDTAMEDNLLVMEAEPSAENLLIFARNAIGDKLPEGVELARLRLYETVDSYAEWVQ